MIEYDESYILLAVRKAAVKGQGGTIVSLFIECIGRTQFQPSIPAPTLVHTRTMRSTRIAMLMTVMKIILDGPDDNDTTYCPEVPH
jgi:hypothetical protein